ncbi:EAL domain-containing protein [Magnetovibrio sp.]|uniref:EAL domain-containing protein n=1 Tax=Magnetovibrio sp. TaxID=2024836 RepID=UPI002F93165F
MQKNDNNTPAPRRSVSLTTLVLALVLAPLIILSAVQVSLYYFSSKETLEAEVQRSFDHSNKTAHLLTKNKLDYLAHLIVDEAESPRLINGFKSNDSAALQAALSEWTNGEAGQHFELLMLHDSTGAMLADLSPPLINSKVLHKAINCSVSAIGQRAWRIVTANDNGKELAALIYQVPVIGTTIGRVQGVLCAGILLNDNLAFLRELKDASSASGVALLADGVLLSTDTYGAAQSIEQLTAAVKLAETGDILESGAYFLSHTPLFQDQAGTRLTMVIALPNTGFQNLRRHYQQGTLIVLALTIVFISLAAWIFRFVALPSLSGLMDYAARVHSQQSTVSYRDGMVREYNHLGKTLQVMVQELQHSKNHLEFLLNEIPVGLVLVDDQQRMHFRNKRFLEMFGYTEEDAPTLDSWRRQAYPDNAYRAKVIETWNDAVGRSVREGTEIPPMEYNVTCKNGDIRTVEFSGITFDGQFLATLIDLTERKQAQKSLYLYANAFEHSGEAMLITDAHNRIQVANPAFCQLTGYSLEDVIGQDPKILSAGRTPPETYQDMWAALNHSGFWQGEIWDRDKSGTIHPKWAAISTIRDDNGHLTHHIASYTDISERKAAEERIYRLAHHDPLTGLLNRFSLESRLEQALMTARREGKRVAVMFIDLDRFKVINDTLGHHIGDNLLVEVAHRLKDCVRESDIVARQGGDEFVVVITGMDDPSTAATIASKISRNLAAPYAISTHDLYSTPSIGISLYPSDGKTVDELMKNADTAMYHAKDLGRNNYQFFSTAMTEEAQDRLDMERDLSTALVDGQFQLYYQPQIRTATGEVIGVEALVRWNHPTRGQVPPFKFIPISEESGLIEPLGSWVLDEACRQLAEWKGQGIAGIRVAVNLSPHQLRSATLVAQVENVLQTHGLSGPDLELEVTESAAMDDPHLAVEQLKALRSLGVSLAIDDFGTGYSSLAYLKVLPIQVLKLDRSFVADIGTGSDDDAISAATMAMARNLKLKVVAEGVETELQSEFLASHGCDILQGYLFGKPHPAEVWTEQWLAEKARASDTKKSTATAS